MPCHPECKAQAGRPSCTGPVGDLEPSLLLGVLLLPPRGSAATGFTSLLCFPPTGGRRVRGMRKPAGRPALRLLLPRRRDGRRGDHLQIPKQARELRTVPRELYQAVSHTSFPTPDLLLFLSSDFNWLLSPVGLDAMAQESETAVKHMRKFLPFRC